MTTTSEAKRALPAGHTAQPQQAGGVPPASPAPSAHRLAHPELYRSEPCESCDGWGDHGCEAPEDGGRLWVCFGCGGTGRQPADEVVL